jgi:hypothetical protein
MKCKTCEIQTREKIFSNGTKHIERYCAVCDGHHGYQRQPVSIERATAFRIEFGKHRGMALPEILDFDPSYVRWLANTASGSVAEMAKMLIEEKRRKLRHDRARAADDGKRPEVIKLEMSLMALE